MSINLPHNVYLKIKDFSYLAEYTHYIKYKKTAQL